MIYHSGGFYIVTMRKYVIYFLGVGVLIVGEEYSGGCYHTLYNTYINENYALELVFLDSESMRERTVLTTIE